MSNFNDDYKDSRANITFNQIKKKRRGKFVVFTVVCLFMASLGSVLTAIIINNFHDDKNYYFNQSNNSGEVITKENSAKLQDSALKVSKSVVSVINVIGNEESTREINVGVGVVVDGDGYIITSYYSLVNATSIKVKAYNDIIYSATLIGFDSVYDIAMLKVENSNLKPIIFAKSPIEVKNGDKIMSVGNPLGKSYNGSVEIGTVMNTRENIIFRNSQSKMSELIKMVKTSVAPKYINTGAALCNLSGELIGVNNTTMAYHNDYLKNSFYISVDDLDQITDAILDKQDSLLMYMGIYGEEAVSQQENGIEGVYAKEVTKSGLAYEAGIRPTDIITEINGMSVNCVKDINDVLGQQKVGDIVNFTVYKNETYSEFKIKIPDGKK